MAMKRPSSFADIMAQAKVVCQETEFEKRKRKRTRFRKAPSSTTSTSSSTSTGEIAQPSDVGPSTFKFSIHQSQQSKSFIDMGHSMMTFRVPLPSGASISTSTSTNPLPQAPFTFTVPLTATAPPSSAIVESSEALSMPQTFPCSSFVHSAPSPPQIIASVNDCGHPASLGTNVKETTAALLSAPPASEPSDGGSNAPPCGLFNKLTRSNRVELALTLLQDGGIDLASFISDVLDPQNEKFVSCQDRLYNHNQVADILNVVSAHPKGKRQLEAWVSAECTTPNPPS